MHHLSVQQAERTLRWVAKHFQPSPRGLQQIVQSALTGSGWDEHVEAPICAARTS